MTEMFRIVRSRPHPRTVFCIMAKIWIYLRIHWKNFMNSSGKNWVPDVTMANWGINCFWVMFVMFIYAQTKQNIVTFLRSGKINITRTRMFAVELPWQLCCCQMYSQNGTKFDKFIYLRYNTLLYIWVYGMTERSRKLSTLSLGNQLRPSEYPFKCYSVCQQGIPLK